MTKLKKAIVFILAILLILVSVNSNIFASTIQQRPANNSTSNNSSSNTSNRTNNNSTNQPSNNTSNNNSNNSSNISGNNNTNSIGGGSSNNTSKPINTSNSTENLPYTGFGDKYFNFALVILLALVLGMFSLVQYNKIIKKENQD